MQPGPSPSIRTQVESLLAAATGHGHFFDALRLYRELTGNNDLALMLNQLIYWSERATRKDGSVFKTSADWKKEIGVSNYAVRQFKKLPFIECRVRKANAYPTTHYRVRVHILLQLTKKYLASQAKAAPGRPARINLSPGSGQPPVPVKSTTTAVEMDRSLTDITSTITPVMTTKRGKDHQNAPPLPSQADREGLGSIKTGSEPVPGSAPGELPCPPDEFPAVLIALAGVTGLDPRLKSHAVRLDKVSRELMSAGYTPANIKAFMPYWRSHDWRYKKDQQLPTPEDVLEQIARSRISPREDFAASWAATING